MKRKGREAQMKVAAAIFGRYPITLAMSYPPIISQLGIISTVVHTIIGNTASLLSLPTLLTSLLSLQLSDLDLQSLTKTMEEKLEALPDLVKGITEVKDSVGKLNALKTSSTALVKLSCDGPEQLSNISTMEWPTNLREELEEPVYVLPSMFHRFPLRLVYQLQRNG
jgi:hypothetical protein